ncbi:MAG: DUF4412 domain-containing protein [candidate division KSB1 bacterium]|nr:DUF4412 domain-containing protein [candidate division KSB1 bacterium]MDZ7288278.1 DUF4412 domain-containing protein [candidate division KSB1 bacterium]MDZ7300498.1 DUF4412 domain-containing protein [candidate division KSB1 bacterium]MDZ7308079.1 DUF4412 domain-containing protein [candidate division KSB1 bacterium]MDZ7351496.1 DUF4412 domain-containing protein [candidate division KSB1 bacterium]
MRVASCFAAFLLLAGWAPVLPAQSFTGIVQQRHFAVPREILFTLAGGITEAPTPEEEAFGFPPARVLQQPVEQLLAAIKKNGAALPADHFTYYFAENGMRVDADLNAGHSLFGKKIIYLVRPQQKQNWLLLPAQQAYLELSAEEGRSVLLSARDVLQSLAQRGAASTAADELPEFKKTGEQSTINGLPCLRYLSKGPGQAAELWVTAAHPGLRRAFDTLLGEMQLGDLTGWQSDAWRRLAHAGVPMLAKHLSPHGGMHVLEITSIQPRAVSAAQFELPADYQKLDLQQLLQEILLKKFVR